LGEPREGNSWYQRLAYYDANPFDAIQAVMVTPVVPGAVGFEPDGFTLFSDASWTANYGNAGQIGAAGNAVNYLEFQVNFYGNMSDPITFDFYALNAGDYVGGVRAAWTGFQGGSGLGGRWIYHDIDPPGVPDGGTTLALLGLSMLGVTALRRKLS